MNSSANLSSQHLPRQRIAVIGGGVAGIVASYLLQQRHEVELYEKNNYLGGHTNTVVIPNGPDAGTPVDTGFIVLNNQNYPLLHRFLQRLKVPVRWSDMSFSYYSEALNFFYAGTTLNGLFAQRSNLLSARYWNFLRELAAFCLRAQSDLVQDLRSLTLAEYCRERQVSAFLLDHYLFPMGAAIWSASLSDIMAFPASTFLAFFKNHGLLSLRNRPRWQTVVGGSHSYVKEFKQQFVGKIHQGAEVEKIERHESFVSVYTASAEKRDYDFVVFASHADQALKLLDAASDDERELLGAWRYQKNHTVLHTDVRLLPPLRRAWASWNYLRVGSDLENKPVFVTYHMNNLQGLKTKEEYCVSLNAGVEPEARRVICEIEYTHPVFSAEAVATQGHLARLNGQKRSFYCGSYCGYGFHEDAVRSAVRVGEMFGCEL